MNCRYIVKICSFRVTKEKVDFYVQLFFSTSPSLGKTHFLFRFVFEYVKRGNKIIVNNIFFYKYVT